MFKIWWDKELLYFWSKIINSCFKVSIVPAKFKFLFGVIGLTEIVYRGEKVFVQPVGGTLYQ